MSASRRALPAILSLLLAASGCGKAPAPGVPRAQGPLIELARRGGDVWAFERRVEGRAAAQCARVMVAGARSRSEAAPRRGRFAVVVPLVSGDNRVRTECLDRSGRTLSSAEVRFRVRLADRPTARVRVSIVEGAVSLDAGASETSPVDRSPLVAFRWDESRDNPAPLRRQGGAPLAGAAEEGVLVAAPPQDGEYFVALEVRDARGVRDRAEAYFRVVDGQPVSVEPEEQSPPWVERAMVYGVVPPLFGEPPLEAVVARLSTLARLGVNTLWITPVQAAPPGDFGYEVLDHFALREEFGTPEDLEALVRAAHAKGMKVLLDFVPNHTSARHAYFEDAEAHGRRSPYYDFYERNAAGEPIHYFDWEHLPNLDFDNPEVRRMILEAAAYWVRRYDVDGYRVDVAWGVDRRAPELFDEIRAELARIDADVVLIAEASARDAHYFDAGFDAAYDWTDEVGKWAWAPVFAEGRVDLDALDAALASGADRGLVFRFLENNDTGARFVTRHGRGLHRAASALLFTLPGIPSLFTGEEVAAEYEPYQREQPLSFEGPAALFAHLAKLTRLRAGEAVLRSGTLIPVEAAPEDRVYAYLRSAGSSGDRALVVINFTGAPVTARLSLGSRVGEDLRSRPEDALDPGPPPVRGRDELRVELEAWGARVLVWRGDTPDEAITGRP